MRGRPVALSRLLRLFLQPTQTFHARILPAAVSTERPLLVGDACADRLVISRAFVCLKGFWPPPHTRASKDDSSTLRSMTSIPIPS